MWYLALAILSACAPESLHFRLAKADKGDPLSGIPGSPARIPMASAVGTGSGVGLVVANSTWDGAVVEGGSLRYLPADSSELDGLGSAHVVTVGTEPGERLGAAVATSHLEGGLVAVGSIGASNAAELAGRVSLYRPAPGNGFTMEAHFDGTVPLGLLGSAITFAADAAADRAWILASAPLGDDGFDLGGVVYVIASDAPTGPADDVATAVIVGYSDVGRELTAVGDLDGDGTASVVLTDDALVVEDPSGLEGTVPADTLASFPGSLLVLHALGGDVDGDGLADLITVGTSEMDVWLGGSDGLRRAAGGAVLDEPHERVDIAEVLATDSSDYYTESVQTAGSVDDVDGDGRADIFFGLESASVLVFGGTWRESGELSGTRLGYDAIIGVESAGDWDQDGTPDLLIQDERTVWVLDGAFLATGR